MARPVITPVMPSASILHSALTSSRLVRPPLAITGTRSSRASLHRGVDVDARQHAVAADVGIDDRLDAVVLELPRQVDHVVPGHLRPALDRHLAVLGVEADDDVAGERGAGVLQEAGVLHRRGADDDVARRRRRGSARSCPGRGCRRPAAPGASSPTAFTMARMTPSFFGLPAAAPFRSTRCSRRAPCGQPVPGHAAGSSENTVASFMSPCFRRTQWPSLISIAGMISIAVGGGKRGWQCGDGARATAEDRADQGFQVTKLASSCRPAVWLFSGWNCTAKILSRATAQVKGKP